MPFTKFTNLDFDQIRTSIKDYLRANSNFTDFDFEGSNFSILIDTLAYNTYITAFNSNMIVNESFLDSATLRENVVSLARNIGYVPRSKSASKAQVIIKVPTTSTSPTATLQAGLVCVGTKDDTSYVFSLPENVTTTINGGYATFGTTTSPIEIYQGTFLKKQFTVDGSLDQRFVLDNSSIDTSTLVVYVKGPSDTGLGREYSKIDNIVGVTTTSETYLIQEVQDEKYELLFGDGFFGKKLQNSSVITATYVVTDGKEGDGASSFTYAGSLRNSDNNLFLPSDSVSITTVQKASNGGDIEPIASVKYFAPRLYASQYRAVTPRDYEAIIQQIYTNTESVSVVGGEELDPPRFGTVYISIKPKNGDYLSDFDKEFILSKLKQYSISGINQQIIDLKVLYVEIDSAIYYNPSQTTNPANLKSSVVAALNEYSESVDMNKFGGRFKYSKALQVIDNTDRAITSNITKIRIRRNLKTSLNQFVQYELCFGNAFHINPEGLNIKSTGFTISGSTDTVYLTDRPYKDSSGKKLDGSKKGSIAIVRRAADGSYMDVIVSAGTVDYATGEIILGPLNVTSTLKENNIIEVQAFPESNDVVGLTDLYLSFSVADSEINMLKDVISSGENISGVTFTKDYYTSSYSNGDLERK
jgi:hypothetical protein